LIKRISNILTNEKVNSILKNRMNKILIPIFLTIFLLSCKEENNREEINQRQIQREQRDAKIDSVYLSMAEKYKAEKNWEDFNYEYLFELQEYLESKNGKFTVKEFYDYEIYKKDSSFFCSYKMDDFYHDFILELELTKSQLEKFRGKRNNPEFHFYGIVVLNIEKIEPIDFEFHSELDDYHSRIQIERYQSLKGKGTIEKIEFVKENKASR